MRGREREREREKEKEEKRESFVSLELNIKRELFKTNKRKEKSSQNKKNLLIFVCAREKRDALVYGWRK